MQNHSEEVRPARVGGPDRHTAASVIDGDAAAGFSVFGCSSSSAGHLVSVWAQTPEAAKKRLIDVHHQKM